MATLDLNELRSMPHDDLVELAQHVPNAAGQTRGQLVTELLRREGTATGAGVLEVLPDGFGFLRDAASSFQPGAEDVYVSPSQIRRFDLRDGDCVQGMVRAPKDNERYFALIKVGSVNGADPDDARDITPFERLTPASPTRAWLLEHGSDLSCRALDLVAPLGRGQRGLLRCPPRSGRTRLLESIARGLQANDPEAEVFLVLLGARPEELREVAHAATVEVVGTSFDEPETRHGQVAEMVEARARRLVEHGRDVVLLVDSLTTLARSGANPRRLFAGARDTVEAGSLTIVGTVRTGPGVDPMQVEDLADCATWDVRLDAALAARRVYPALDVAHSANHRLDHVVGAEHAAALDDLRGRLDSTEALLAELRATPSNTSVLDGLGLDRSRAAGN